MTATSVFEILFAAAVLVAAASLGAALAGYAGRKPLIVVSGGIGAVAAAAWGATALDPSRSLAIAAAGLTACMLVGLAAVALEAVLARARAADRRIAEAEQRIDAHVAEVLVDR